MASEETLIHVEVAYALPDQQKVIRLAVTPDTQVKAIIEQSGILSMFPSIDLSVNKVGIYSKNVALDEQVHDGDRIEIYRPLIADPREIRQKRLAQQAKDKK